MCNIEKQIKNFYKSLSECKGCNRTSRLKRYYENEVKKSIQQKIYHAKNRDKMLIQKTNNRCIQVRDLVRSYVEMENRLKALEGKSQTQQLER